MSDNTPPNPNVNTFNNLYWITGDSALTQNQADLRYLKFPIAQGTENLKAIGVDGVATFNNDVLQTGATNNIIQDQTTNSDANRLKATDIYGDLNLRRPTTTGGGAMRLWDVVSNSGNSSQLYNTGTQLAIVNLNNGGSTTFTTTDGAGVQSQPVSVNSALTTINNPASFTSTTPPISSQVIPASSDSSSKIPTTAWTQGAIDAKIPTSLLGLNNTWTGTNDFVNTGTGSLTSSAVQPVASDSSNKVPTTAWVQSAISAIPTPVLQTNTAEHYSTALNNVYPFGTNPATIPLINFADVNTYAGTYGVQFWDAVVFDFVFNLTISGVNTNFTDAGGVGINNNQVSGTMYVYPTAFTTSTPNPTPYFYLNGGVGSTSSGSSTYNNCPVTAYTPNGRPFWVNNLLNQANVLVVMPVNTINTGTTAQLVFYFSPISWNSTTECNWNLSITLRNSGKIPVSKITTQNFNINNI
jgi:hypothetical protein